MIRALRHALFAAALLGLTSGCGISQWFYAELEEPGICKTFVDVVMDPTAPGADLVKQLPPIPLSRNIPLFDSSAGGVQFKLLSLTFLGKQGIQDFNSVNSAWITALPDPNGTSGLPPTELIRYDKAPGVTPGLELTIGGTSDIDLVPFLTSSGEISVEARMVGGLPNNPWVADITGCIYAKARVNYLGAYGINF